MEEISIRNERGLEVILLPFGAAIKSVFFPDINGEIGDLALGFDNFDGYSSDTMQMGRTVGRVCNRIRNGKMVLNGFEYQLPINCPPHHIHGGPNGTSNRTWEVIRRSNVSVTFRVELTNKEDGYPGDVKIDCTYTVNDLNQLIIEHTALSNADTVVNLTNHTYWNLDGQDSIAEHELQIRAANYLPTDETSLPTGEIFPVAETPLDFTTLKKLSEIVDQNSIVNIDHDFVLDESQMDHLANVTLTSHRSGIVMEIYTSNPVAHVYTGQNLDCEGKSGKHYGPNAGIAIECQGYTDAINNPKFPSIVVKCNERFCKEIVFGFGHKVSRKASVSVSDEESS